MPDAEAQYRAARNHIDWFTKLARASGQATGATRGLTWAGDGARHLLFPELEAGGAGESLDAFFTVCRAEAAVTSIGCWSLVPTQPLDLGARLLARGFEWGWRPHWMRLDLAQWDDGLSGVPGVTIGPDDLDGPAARGLEQRSQEGVLASRRMADAGEAWHIGARERGRLIGHVAVSLFATDGSAGIYNCAVAPRQRRRGIGAALTAAACRIARERGCDDALLNATDMGEPVYRRIGFASAGFGQTWWLHEHRLRAPLSGADVRFAEAVGAGRVDELSLACKGMDLDGTLLCGLTPMEVAARCQQPRSAEWLVAHGATLDLISCWDFGWKGRAAELVAHRPSLLSVRRGEFGATPLHIAVDRDDEELVRFILGARPDLGLTDTRFKATALGWAQHQGRTRVAEIIAAAV